ncbi:hypothetical protein B0H16DRAFT_1465778 [Mycena metata]|uniref:Uncharacterized protein n=1 Tax=Mycena metata TaxID=1033252 RepID=A0AAD7IBI0_9AGAR|nr:hypothetical protein B0H16DRAFT_1465778 [Mycena metata]
MLPQTLATPSQRKDRFQFIAIHRKPPGLSIREFETKVESFMDDLAALPIVQKNILKFEMMTQIQNEPLDDYIKLWGYPLKESVVIIALQCESADHYIAVNIINCSLM